MDPLNNPAELASRTLRETAVETAWLRALQTLPTLSLLNATGGSLKKAMEEAVDKVLALGVVDSEELVGAAIEKIPKLRKANGSMQGPR